MNDTTAVVPMEPAYLPTNTASTTTTSVLAVGISVFDLRASVRQVAG